MATESEFEFSTMPADFEGLLGAWDRLAKSRPDFGLCPGKFSASRFTSRAFNELSVVGVMRRARNGRLFVHRELFEPALFAWLTNADIESAIRAALSAKRVA